MKSDRYFQFFDTKEEAQAECKDGDEAFFNDTYGHWAVRKRD